MINQRRPSQNQGNTRWGKSRLSVVNASAYDPWVVGLVTCLTAIGLIMVVSTSVAIAEARNLHPLYYFWRQLLSIIIVVVLALNILRFRLAFLSSYSTHLLFIAITLLVLVFVPGLGREVNGSMRWLDFGFFTFQSSELAKLAVIVYLAAYLVRHNEAVRGDFLGFIKPIIVVAIVVSLLILEPDYGSAVVLFFTCLGMLFLAGVPLLRFVIWGITTIGSLAGLSLLAPYRLERLFSFTDPWADPFDKGFQLVQALIAFGRGEWTGVGLGNSVQKLYYLPEVHTDFVFAVIGEELGLLGSLCVIVLFLFLFFRIFQIGGIAEKNGFLFAAYLTYGIGLLLGLQAFVNIGVNLGVLPTKGLPLPFLSYGNNNLIVTGIAIALVLRAGYEAGAIGTFFNKRVAARG